MDLIFADKGYEMGEISEYTSKLRLGLERCKFLDVCLLEIQDRLKSPLVRNDYFVAHDVKIKIFRNHKSRLFIEFQLIISENRRHGSDVLSGLPGRVCLLDGVYNVFA